MSDQSKVKASKVPVTRGCLNYFPRALTEVAKVSVFGAEKHGTPLEQKGFLREEYTLGMYDDAIARHHLALGRGEEVNLEDGELLHRAQRAWNSLASLEKYLIGLEKAEIEAIILDGFP